MKHARRFPAIGLAGIRSMAVACICISTAFMLHAQNPGQLSIISDPTEFHAYQNATTQSDPKAKAAALETFLTTYPQTPVKKDILNQLLGAYQAVGDTDNMLSSANRLLQVDPANFQALFVSVYVKKLQCGKTSDPQTCDDAAALAHKGLTSQKPAGTSGDDWKKLTGAAFPIFHSAIAADDYIAKKDFKAAEDEYKAELMLYTDAQSQTQGLPDTLMLAQAYSLPGAGQDLVKAVWFYARVWDFAPAAYKAQIEPKLEYYYQKYHGNLEGIDEVKTAAAGTLFPPGTLENDSAMQPAATSPAAPAQRQYEDVAPPPPPLAPAPTISMGQTKSQVTAAFGEPQRKAAAGPKEIFFYTDMKMKVTFTNGKVSSIE